MSKTIGIVGYRGYTNAEGFNKMMNSLNEQHHILKNVGTIVSGGATGVDTLAEQWANTSGYKFIKFPPEYITYGDKAPLIRNQQIVDASDEIIAFVSPNSRGTKHTISLAKKAEKKCYIIKI
jgi:hypothetical protein